jgi:flagellar motor switch protein FliN
MDEMTDHLELQELAPPGGMMQHGADASDLERSALELAPVYDVPVNIKAVLGRSTMDVANLLKLGAGSLIELDRKVGEAIDIYVNNRLVARGELVVVEDRLGVTMTEIIKDGDGQ